MLRGRMKSFWNKLFRTYIYNRIISKALLKDDGTLCLTYKYTLKKRVDNEGYGEIII